ncbi:hypothetical protein [Pseudoalteromonas luteoviolacea]|uniref:Glycosyltransferase 2-like domain-containing protein n=1 Tax=Pseudoalteromonas luteoviolacea H33 TaxID=1365251 RepID=A0A167EC92_9GAMM|nr:hypothetical protein [Pseudoalteromonas luteoviolacea]KZN50387.1 hypothetical protein N476_16200 [Pseudoalteromonas luteoviolacea H33]KZN77964.1 hypothetical protein N477_11265 [Pseudoalteromonas luteoviolacea H33-S]MBQ4879525.1 hypothetical protein [Pseudoalteromonas luteoviolacea]MBQ4908548.1 hypothetical protein [Pseudoalteromonas luteoviolacea]
MISRVIQGQTEPEDNALFGIDTELTTDHDEMDITCICVIEQCSELNKVLSMLEHQSLCPMEVVICHPPSLRCEVSQQASFTVRSLPFDLPLNLNAKTPERLALAINCDYVVICPEACAWISNEWLSLQLYYLKNNKLDAIGLSQSGDFVSVESCSYLQSNTFCCTKEFFLAKHRALDKQLGFEVKPNQYSEHSIQFPTELAHISSD